MLNVASVLCVQCYQCLVCPKLSVTCAQMLPVSNVASILCTQCWQYHVYYVANVMCHVASVMYPMLPVSLDYLFLIAF